VRRRRRRRRWWPRLGAEPAHSGGEERQRRDERVRHIAWPFPHLRTAAATLPPAKATRNDDRHSALIAAENAPLDDMPETEEERLAVERGREDIRAGRTFAGDVVSKALREGRLADLLKR